MTTTMSAVNQLRVLPINLWGWCRNSTEWGDRNGRHILQSQLSFAAYEVYSDRIIIKGIGTDNSVFDQGIIPLQSA
jgi:hypothetical protein